jgi:hypothetical protein
MKALIHGDRVAQVVNDGDEFPVASPLRWINVKPGDKAVLSNANTVGDYRFEARTGQIVFFDPKAGWSYKERRLEAYAPIAKQLDMIYWDKINETTTWFDHITAVKAAHPKPKSPRGQKGKAKRDKVRKGKGFPKRT